MTKVGIAILGPGLLGLALADRLRGSALLDLRLIAGREGEPGLGAIVADESIGIVFDTTGAAAHAEHAASLEAAGKRVIDLTPSAAREVVVPTVDLDIADGRLTLHLVSSAAQVAAPFAHALKEEAGVEYVEVVSTIAAATAGWGTRSNIDELTEGTALAVGAVAGAAEARALVFLGSGRADRPMSNTVFARLADPEAGDVVAAVEATAARLAGEIRGLHLSQFERDAALVTLRIDVGAEGEGGVPNSLEPLIATALMTAEVVASKVVEV